MPIADIQAFLTALFIGALVGVERTLDKRGQPGKFIGLRTFILISQVGSLAAWIGRDFGTPFVFLLGLVCTTIFLGLGFYTQNRDHEEFPGLVTELAGVVVYLLSGVAVLGYVELAVAMAIVTTGLLALKEKLHGLAAKIRSRDLLAALQLLFASFIVLPVLPNRTIDPLEAINPQKLWLLVIFISALSLVGYAATRLFGPNRGAAFTGIFGGLVSSTAVTLDFSRRSAQDQHQYENTYAIGLFVSWFIMFLRMFVLLAVINRELLHKAAPALMAAGAVPLLASGLIAWRLKRRGRGGRKQALPSFDNPFRLWSAIKFASLFAVVLVLVRAAEIHFPRQGLYYVAAIAGITDVDAISLTLADLSRSGGVASALAAQAILLAALVNTISKTVLVSILGSAKLRFYSLLVAVLCCVAGVAAFSF